ncbi:Hypothetical protein PHPALM_37385 [Phytophthora palmivora]|uniref:MULE transposase domain-containing protein n=1 Tax=Phytophthora palmivora TaxID=4796 RepID=A0A2P4WXJ9_9STRA|nr:Hypothetical protein PHPALM_37385 [Phytophthora palmivora]
MNIASTKRQTKGMVKYLMCFFHVVKNIAEKVSSFPADVVSTVFKHLYLMHYARDTTEFTDRYAAAQVAWTAIPQLKFFTEYFKKQWIDSPFSNWGCYHTPTGFAKTNNPVEQFNNAIKRDYSLRTLLKLVALVEQLTLMCCHRSRGTIVFSLESKPNRELQDRYKYLLSEGRLSIIQPHKHGLDFLLDGPSETHVAYVYQRGAPPRLPVPDQGNEKKRLGKRNKHYMETMEQPVGGWRVDMEARGTNIECVFMYWQRYVRREDQFRGKDNKKTLHKQKTYEKRKEPCGRTRAFA